MGSYTKRFLGHLQSKLQFRARFSPYAFMGSPKSSRSTFTELIVPPRVNLGRPIIQIGVHIYIDSAVKITDTVLGFHQQVQSELRFRAFRQETGALPRAHTSFPPTPRRLHTTHVNSTQHPATHTVSARAGTTPIRSTSHQPDLLPVPARQAGHLRAHGRWQQPTNGCW